MKNKIYVMLVCIIFVFMSINVYAANEIIDTNNTIVTIGSGSVVDTGEPSEGYAGIKVQPYGVGDYYYFSDPDPIPTADGGKLYSHAERQKYGDLSGTVRTFRYYIYSKYEGNSTVEKVSSEWYTTAKLRSSATLTLNTTLGTSCSVSAGIQSTWQNVQTPTKTWTNSNGTKTTYEQSNFAVAPDNDLYGFEVSIVHTSKLKLNGDAKTYSLTSGC